MLRRLFRHLPDGPRARLLQVRLLARDAWTRDARFARPDTPHALPQRHRWTQAIHATSTAEAKRHNLRLAATALQRTTIAPGEVFSFARVIGPPILSRGYRAGRTLVGGEIAASIGGGLCQLSGLLYLAALECGLEIVERHPHSLDIYTETTRFAPLGADATVVYGHRDLRLRNTLGAPVGFRCDIASDVATLWLCSDASPTLRQVEFRHARTNDAHACIVTLVDGVAFCEQRYARPVERA